MRSISKHSPKNSFTIHSPVDGRLCATVRYAYSRQITSAVNKAESVKGYWQELSLDERAAFIAAFVNAMAQRREEIAETLAWSIGRPLQQADEVGALEADMDLLVSSARRILAAEERPGDNGINRYVQREPYGVCLSISAWNYPVAMATDLVIAPLLVGNVVIYKHAPQTALIADHIAEAFHEAGLPAGVFQSLHMTHLQAGRLLRSGHIDKLLFIGSTRGGREVYKAAVQSPKLIPPSLELGGKDPSYIRPDADVEKLVPDLITGVVSNSGQSCCSVERIYVHADVYEHFIDCFVDTMEKQVTLGHPIYEQPTIGTVISADAATRIRREINGAITAGAKTLLPSGRFGSASTGTAYVEPQILVNVDHTMSFMRKEIFGPCAGIMKVNSDEEALTLMNDSDYGLTASVWTQDVTVFKHMANKLETGTVYLNRCDHADTLLPWGGYKHSGIGRCSGGVTGYEYLTQIKSCHLRTDW